MSEQELVKRLQRGDAEAPHLLYTRYVRYLTAVCARYITNDEDVRDILQESFPLLSIAAKALSERGSRASW